MRTLRTPALACAAMCAWLLGPAHAQDSVLDNAPLARPPLPDSSVTDRELLNRGYTFPGDTVQRPSAPPATVAPEAVRDMMGTWRGRVLAGETGSAREVGLELKLKDDSTVSVVFIWGPGADQKEDPPGLASGEGDINLDGTVVFKFAQTPLYEVTLVMSLDFYDQLLMVWNELDTQRLRLRKQPAQLRRIAGP